MLPTRRDRQWLPDIFSDFLNNDWMVRPNATAPAINVIESEKEYKVEVAAPGMERDDFNIRINDQNQLVVSMEKKEEKKEEREKERYLRREFSYTHFQQAIVLPDNIEKDKIEAKMEHGVLNISIPKVADHVKKAEERLIEIK